MRPDRVLDHLSSARGYDNLARFYALLSLVYAILYIWKGAHIVAALGAGTIVLSIYNLYRATTAYTEESIRKAYGDTT